MSLRPEEISRRALASYGQIPPTTLHAQPEDGTEILAKFTAAFELGDWVECAGLASGHLTAQAPSADGTAKWMGVVQHKGAANTWGKVKTAGVSLAKVASAASATTGDSLSLRSGSTDAVVLSTASGGRNSVCGRFMKKEGGDSKMSLVHIGSGNSGLTIHHHTDESNTEWHDTTDSTVRKGLSWHLFKVNLDEHTGGVARLMLAMGGGTTHGESSKEGYFWGGVVGSNAALGFGSVGGNESAGKQGVLGAERQTSDAVYRVNIRSFAGFNAYDRYGGLTYPKGVGPIRFTHPNLAPTFRAHSDCDASTPACPAGTIWWAGSMMWDAVLPPVNNASWNGQWVPGMTIERDCCDVSLSVTPTDHDGCAIITNPSQFVTNVNDLNGAYEWIIPYGYTANVGRLDLLAAHCCLTTHVQRIWAFLDAWTAKVERFMQCVDATFATKANGAGTAGACCSFAGTTSVPVLTCGPGPDGGDCAATA